MKKIIEKLLLENKTSEAKHLIYKELNNNSDIDKSYLYLFLGQCYVFEGNNDLALQYFNEAYIAGENNLEIVQTICNFLTINGAKDAAIELMAKFNLNQNIPIIDDFDYGDFLLDSNSSALYDEELFDYTELITSDVNEILTNYNLEKIDKHKKIIENTENKIKPRLLFTMFGWNEIGGGTTLPKSICIELVNRGYEVFCFYAALEHPTITEPYYMEQWIDNGVNLFGVFNRPTISHDFDNPLREICDNNIVKLFNKVLDNINPDIVNFHNFVGLSFEIASIVKQRNIVSTFTTHNYHLIDPKLYLFNDNLESWKNTDFFTNSDLISYYPTLTEEYKQRINKAKNILLNDIDYVFAVSNRVKELLTEFIDNTEVSNKKISVINQINNSVSSLSKIKNITNQKTKLPLKCSFLGHCTPHKGVHLIAQALQFIPNAKQIFQIDIWGNITSDYEKAIKIIDKENILNFKGEYSPNELNQIAENTDIMLFLSLWEECQGLVIIESLSMNIPVITAKIGGVEDMIIDGYNGQLFTAGNPKSLASVLQMLIENLFKIEQMQQNSYIPYTFADYISHLETIYERLFNGERPEAKELNLIFKEKLFE